jgi:hypothetical protein
VSKDEDNLAELFCKILLDLTPMKMISVIAGDW